MVRAATALVCGLTLAIGLGACGGGNSDVSDVVPKTIPDLVAPKDTSLPEVTAANETSTDTTATTPTAGTGATTTPQQSTPTATTGGTTGGTGAATTQTTPAQTNTNGSQAGGLSPFCDTNPDAC